MQVADGHQGNHTCLSHSLTVSLEEVDRNWLHLLE